MMLLEVNSIYKEYEREDRKFQAVNDASFSMDTGEFISITGRSGSGKSTLINIIGGLLKPTSGEVVFRGKKISGLSDNELSDYRNVDIGFVPQGGSLLAGLNVLDNVRLPFYMMKREGDSVETAVKLLEALGISHLKYMYPSKLSGGEMRRVSIARALMNSPALLIADEPTGDLDVNTTKEIMELFREICNKGTSVLIVTHEPDAASLSDRSFEMAAGCLEGKGE